MNTNYSYIESITLFNSVYNQSRYVGYMYGGYTNLTNNRKNTTSSTIKRVLDTWYQNKLSSTYYKYISKSAIYCNDRSVSEGTYVTAGDTFYYGTYTRLVTNKKPTYKCGGNTSGGLFENTQAIEDKFSASTDGGGNGMLDYPIGLMTADEVSFAGGLYGKSLSSPYAWYYTNSAGKGIITSYDWWLMSPERFLGGIGSYVFYVYSSSNYGRITSNGAGNDEYAVRCVISIDPCAKVTGTGTSEDPYVIDEVNSTC